MRKYNIIVFGGLVGGGYSFTSNSRNAKQHIVDTGADNCIVQTLGGKDITAASRDENGRAQNVLLWD